MKTRRRRPQSLDGGTAAVQEAAEGGDLSRPRMNPLGTRVLGLAMLLLLCARGGRLGLRLGRRGALRHAGWAGSLRHLCRIGEGEADGGPDVDIRGAKALESSAELGRDAWDDQLNSADAERQLETDSSVGHLGDELSPEGVEMRRKSALLSEEDQELDRHMQIEEELGVWDMEDGDLEEAYMEIDEADLERFAAEMEDALGDDFEGEIMEIGGPEGGDGEEGLLLCKFSKGIECRPAELEPVVEDIRRLKDLLGYHDYDMSLHFATDEEVQELNANIRGVDAPTDILSFPSPFVEFKAPEQLCEPEVPDNPKDLGDIVISVPYVRRAIERDREDFEKGELCVDEDRGVSREMATKFTLRERFPLLAIHGMLHLLGHDHEEDDEYELMVQREEEVYGQYLQQ
eukprot:scaffold869_cov303-Pinguiococcus_pyrenoidosus.AAC.14